MHINFINIINISIIYKIFIIYIIMDKPTTIIKFMNDNLYLFENIYDDVDKNVLKAAIAYKYLLHVYLGIRDMTIDQILKENENDIGLIGPGYNCIVSVCEKLCGNRIYHLHSILHNVYGRLYNQYKVGRGYNYTFKAPGFIKKSPLCGHITGLLFSIYYNIRYHSSYQV